MKHLLRAWHEYLNKEPDISLLQEEFYLQSDSEFSRPLARELVDVLGYRLPGSVKAQELDPLQASGAEGVVLSLDDHRVIKMFHSLDNAVKNLPLVSKNVPETAQVYSTGQIAVDKPVIYFKRGSSYSPADAIPTEVLYYIVMQRVTPDPYIYRYVEIAYDSYNRFSNVNFNKLLELYQIGDAALNSRLDQIFVQFMKTFADNERIQSYNNIKEFLSTASKKQRNIIINEFNRYRKSRTKEFVFITETGIPIHLKKMLLNDLGIEHDVPYDARKILNALSQTRPFLKKPKKSFTGDTVAQDLTSILELIKTLRIDKGIAWNDIHQEQFGRDKKNNLIALDLGIKSGKPDASQKAAFSKNVSRLSVGGKELKSLSEQKDKITTLNVFDFDRTLFFTHDSATGKEKYEKVFNKEYPHKGWFGKEESLLDELDIKENEQMRRIYKNLSKKKNTANVLISNRIYYLEDRLIEFLKDRGYHFDDVSLAQGSKRKPSRLEEIWDHYPDIKEINIFDDLGSAIEQYKELQDLYGIWRTDVIINIYQVSPRRITKI